MSRKSGNDPAARARARAHIDRAFAVFRDTGQMMLLPMDYLEQLVGSDLPAARVSLERWLAVRRRQSGDGE